MVVLEDAGAMVARERDRGFREEVRERQLSDVRSLDLEQL